MIEDAVLYAALKKYLLFCQSCLQNQENHDQLAFIRGEISIITSLQDKIKQDYLRQGGDPSQIEPS